MNPPILAYDIEIKKGIPNKNDPPEMDIEYCAGWRDFENMGIALISCYDFQTRTPRLFMDDNLFNFFAFIEHNQPLLVGFNNNNFDDNLLKLAGVPTRPFQKDTADSDVNVLVPMSFDLLRAIWKAAGLDPNSYGYHHQGFGLDDVCMANLGFGKFADGAAAAIMYQRKQFGRLCDYGLRDIMLTAYLLDLCARQPIINPKNPSQRLFVEIPFAVPPISASL